MPNLNWMDDALCREIDGELFFPEPHTNANHARKACSLCPVQQDCLEYALRHDFEGIWGGTTQRERSRLRRKVA